MNPKKLKMLLLFGYVVLLSGCATNVMVAPQPENQYEITSYHDEESTAMKNALKKAEKVCKKKNMECTILDKKTDYQGVLTPAATKISKNFQQFIFQATSVIIPTTATSEDYKVSLKAQCVPKKS